MGSKSNQWRAWIDSEWTHRVAVIVHLINCFWGWLDLTSLLFPSIFAKYRPIPTIIFTVATGNYLSSSHYASASSLTIWIPQVSSSISFVWFILGSHQYWVPKKKARRPALFYHRIEHAIVWAMMCIFWCLRVFLLLILSCYLPSEFLTY